MTTITVYDPAMCCSTGICGTDVDQRLVDLAADLDWLKAQGVRVQRFGLSREPAEFGANNRYVRSCGTARATTCRSSWSMGAQGKVALSRPGGIGRVGGHGRSEAQDSRAGSRAWPIDRTGRCGNRLLWRRHKISLGKADRRQLLLTMLRA